MTLSVNTKQVVTVQAVHADLKGDNKLFFLFSPAQVEEVLSGITLRPVPFAPPFLQGITNWRGHLLPVVDIEKRFAFSKEGKAAKNRFLVLRTGAADNQVDKQVLHCVLRFSEKITPVEISDACTAIDSKHLNVEPSLVRGAYQQNTNIYIIPDLISILHNQQSLTR